MVTQSSLGAFLEHAKVNKCEVSDEIEFRLDPVTGIGAFCKKPVQKVDVSLIRVPIDFTIKKKEAEESRKILLRNWRTDPLNSLFFCLCVFILVLSFFFYFWGETGDRLCNIVLPGVFVYFSRA